MGAAGPSNAISVAEKMGLPESVLTRADGLLMKGPVQVDRLMANLSDQAREIAEKETDLAARRRRRLKRGRTNWNAGCVRKRSKKAMRRPVF